MLWLLIFAPLTIVLDRWSGAPAPVVFFAAALAIVPMARLIVHGTEGIAHRTGPAIGGLLNATFGNLPELIICVVALRAGLVDMVRASLVGALLANLLLALGVSFFLGGLKHHHQDYNPVAARANASMMLIAAISMAIPSGFHRFFGAEQGFLHSSALDLSIAIVLLVTYALYLVYQLRTHSESFAAGEGPAEAHDGGGPQSLPRAVGTLVGASLAAAWMSEILVGAAEATGHSLGMSPVFMGLVVLAVIGGAAESSSAIAMGRRNKMDLSVNIALGSSIQIALFVAPLLVLIGRVAAPVPFALSFSRGEMGALFIAVLLGTLIIGDGRSNWFKGVQLIAIYIIMAAVCYLVPAGTAP